jgi:UDP-glucose 4-epimerase
VTRVALIGASGFLGAAVHRALHNQGAQVVTIRAPRLTTAARSKRQVQAELHSSDLLGVVARLRNELCECDVVINAAGVADATASGDALYGANALLPGAIAKATPRFARLVHVSSAGVQGRRLILDETEEVAPFSPYTASKALGEAVTRSVRSDAVVYRPTSVHGDSRAVTAAMLRVLRSKAASVASGDRPTPQILAANVGDAAAFIALSADEPPAVVLHPWEGLTTHSLFALLDGRRPLVIPVRLARGVLSAAHFVGQFSGAIAGVVRRVEMLWFGQRQGSSWLDDRWQPPVGLEGWREIATSVHLPNPPFRTRSSLLPSNPRTPPRKSPR